MSTAAFLTRGSADAIDALLTVARSAADAGAAVLSESAEAAQVEQKGPSGNLVTDIDVAAERAVRASLQAARPGDLISGEELADSGGHSSHFRWCIDPLDGTANFVRGLPFDATSVAVQDLRDGTWLAGAISAPALGKRFWAARGKGAWLHTCGNPRRLTGPDPEPSARLVGTGYSYEPAMREQQFDKLPTLMTSFDDARNLGSAALGLALVAEGVLDAFVEAICTSSIGLPVSLLHAKRESPFGSQTLDAARSSPIPPTSPPSP